MRQLLTLLSGMILATYVHAQPNESLGWERHPDPSLYNYWTKSDILVKRDEYGNKTHARVWFYAPTINDPEMRYMELEISCMYHWVRATVKGNAKKAFNIDPSNIVFWPIREKVCK